MPSHPAIWMAASNEWFFNQREGRLVPVVRSRMGCSWCTQITSLDLAYPTFVNSAVSTLLATLPIAECSESILVRSILVNKNNLILFVRYLKRAFRKGSHFTMTHNKKVYHESTAQDLGSLLLASTSVNHLVYTTLLGGSTKLSSLARVTLGCTFCNNTFPCFGIQC